jgi:hypothetical protein
MSHNNMPARAGDRTFVHTPGNNHDNDAKTAQLV